MKDAVRSWNHESNKRKQGQKALTHGGLLFTGETAVFTRLAIAEVLTSVFLNLIHLQTLHPPPAPSSATKQDLGSRPLGLGSRGSRGMRNSAASLTAQGFWG